MIVATGDHETSEVRLIPAADPLAEPILVRPREKGVEYDVDERDGTLFVHANDTHENFRLATAPLAGAGRVDHADRGLGRVLPDRVRAVQRLLRDRGPARRARSDRGALLRRSGADRADRVPRGELHRLARQQSRMGHDASCGCRTNSMVSPASTLRLPCRRRGGSSCSRCRKSPRATTARSTPPSGSRSPRATAPRSRSA